MLTEIKVPSINIEMAVPTGGLELESDSGCFPASTTIDETFVLLPQPPPSIQTHCHTSRPVFKTTYPHGRLQDRFLDANLALPFPEIRGK